MIIVNDLTPGVSFTYENNLYLVLDIQHNKTAMRKMVIKVKSKNMRTGAITDLAFTGGDKIETIHIDKSQMQYLYDDGEFIVFMDTETYEQVSLDKSKLAWELKFLRPNEVVEIISYNGEFLGINLPAKVALKVIKTEPGVKGDTATRAMKDATLETGLVIKVPLFVEQDEEVYVRTDTGAYDSRA